MVRLDAPTVKDVKAALSFDLLADDAFGKLATDDLLLVDTLWVLCRSQAGSITDVEFGQALATGEAIEAGAQALIQARRDFFRPGKRSLLRSLEEEQAAILAEGMAKAQAKVSDPALRARLMATLEAKMDQSLEAIFGQLNFGQVSAMNSPVSAASGRKD